jgi:large conductance mechanosensitive channel
MIREFKEFAVKGNMLDLAIGLVLGAAFGAAVNSLVGDIFTPLIGLITGGVDFKALAITLRAAEGDNPPLLLNYGSFLQVILNFLIVAVVLFFLIKAMNRLRRAKEKEPAPPPEPPREEILLEEIRDILKSRT